MSIVTRFRSVVWVAGIAFAALACYLVSLKVAAERAQVARLDTQLASARADIRQLTTELGTRSRLVQLERWNTDVLALTAPKAGQYLSGEMQLASLAVPAAEPAQPQTAAAQALQAPAAVAQVAYRRVDDRPASRLLHSVSLDLDDGARRPALHAVALVRAKLPALSVAYLDPKTVRP